MSVLVAFSVAPSGTASGGDSVGEVVAEVVRVVRESGLPSETNAMFTNVEGEWDEVMAVVKRAVEVCAAASPRVSLVLKADVREGVTGALRSKVATVERHLAGARPVADEPAAEQPAEGPQVEGQRPPVA
jgi:uncharacterized protein (TIGR00106 family)